MFFFLCKCPTWKRLLMVWRTLPLRKAMAMAMAMTMMKEEALLYKEAHGLPELTSDLRYCFCFSFFLSHAHQSFAFLSLLWWIELVYITFMGLDLFLCCFCFTFLFLCYSYFKSPGGKKEQDWALQNRYWILSHAFPENILGIPTPFFIANYLIFCFLSMKSCFVYVIFRFCLLHVYLPIFVFRLICLLVRRNFWFFKTA